MPPSRAFWPPRNGLVDDAVSYVRQQAKAGAEQAIPRIRAEVRAEVRPYVIVSLAVGALGVVLGAVAIARTMMND